MIDSLNALETFIHEHGDVHDPLVRSYLVHYQFEAIHPFRDGNGRIGRLLLALTTWMWCGLTLPWLYMSPYFERFKDEYIDNMFRLSTHGDWDRWIEFCLNGTIAQSKDAMRKCDALGNLRERMKAQMGGRARLTNVIDSMFIAPIFTSAEVANWGGNKSLATARRDIEELEKAGWVKYLDGHKPKTYYCPWILSIAYNERDSQDRDVSEATEPVAKSSE